MHLLRITASALSVFALFVTLMWLLGARLPLGAPEEDPKLVALKRDPVAMEMVRWIKDEIETEIGQRPSNNGCYRIGSKGICVLGLYNRRVYVKVWIDQGGAHWRPLQELKA